MMRRRSASNEEPRSPVRPPRAWPGKGLWSQLVRPAVLIGLLGALAVLHLWACARLSVIECDKQRLRRIAGDDQARRAELRRELDSRRNAEVIRKYGMERGLQKPVAVVEVTVDEVPGALRAEMPGDRLRAPGDGIRLGQVAPEAGVAPGPAPQSLQ